MLTPLKHCPVCESTDKRCRQREQLILCMTLVDALDVPGYRYLRPTKNQQWGMWVEDTDQQGDTEEWQRRLEQRRRQNAAKEKHRRSQCLSPDERDRWYRQILGELTLSDAHHQALEQRGMTPAQIEAGLYRSVVAGQHLGGIYPRNLPGIGTDGRSLIIGGAGIVSPVLNPKGLITGLVTRLDNHTKNKYRWVSWESCHRLPNDEPPLDHRSGGDFPWVAFVEGAGSPKPYLAALRLGCDVVGAAGGNFGTSPEQVKAALESGKTPVLLPDGGAIANTSIMRQYRRLAELVPSLQVLWWGQRAKTDGDVDEVEPAQLEAAQLISWADFEAMAIAAAPTPIQGLRRCPHLHIDDREFKEAVEQIPHRGLVALHGSTGSGKGEAIAELLKAIALPWLSVTTLRSLAREQAADWDGVVVNQGDRVGSQLLRDGQPVLGGVVCVPSLLATRGQGVRVLILDELPAIQEFLLRSKLANKRGIRPLLIEELQRRIQQADLVIVASADLNEEALQWVEGIRGEQAFLVQSNRRSLGYPCHQIQGIKDQAIGDYLEHATRAHQAGKVTVFHSDSKAIADQVAGLLTEQGLNPLLITADTSGGDVEASFLSSKGLDLPALLAAGVGAIVTSPSVKEGFSIKHNTCMIDSVWGVFEGGSITAEAMAQTLDRVRCHTIPRYLWVAERGRAYSKLSKEESVGAFMREFRRASTDALKLARRSLLTDRDIEAGAIDWTSPTIKLLASIEVQRNRGMKALRARVETLLKGRGKQLLAYVPNCSTDDAKTVRDMRKAIRSKQQMERAIAIEKAEDITEATARLLEKREDLKPDELRQLERFYLQQFYRLEHITAKDALWDKEGKRREAIRRLERVLNPELATTATADSINQNASTPQDWHRAALQRRLLEDSGAAQLVQDIWAGDVVELSPMRVEAIATWLQKKAREFKEAFGFSNAHAVTSNQLVFYLLDWVGLTRQCTRSRVNGKAIRRYSIDTDNLEKLKHVVERRSQADPPPETSLLIQGGGSLPEWLDLPAEEAADFTDLWLKATTLEEKHGLLAAVEECREAIAA